MARLTITLSEQTHRQLKVRAALHDRTIGDLIEEELALAREARRQRARDALDAMSRHRAKVAPEMSEDEMTELAVDVARELRHSMLQEQQSGSADR